MYMKPGFWLNCHDREKNPCFESHDPSMMWDPVGRLYYSYCTDTAVNSRYRQGIPVRRSKDLVEFEFVGYALSEEAAAQGRDNGEGFAPTESFWAPYVEYCGGEYRMYYSATKAFGSSESRIWLAAAQKPEGPFENRGVVMDTWNTPDTEPNAIDPHVADTKDGRKFLIYGSYFGGIFIKELDPETGMPVPGDPFYQGERIAKKPAGAHVDGPEGAAVIYCPETDYYYLFLSYGWLGDNYDIRVGRSREITGPYLDYFGRKLDGESLGMKLAGSYFFEGGNVYAGTEEREWRFAGFRGPGHGVPFYAPERNEYFFVHHVRDGAEMFKRQDRNLISYRMHYMMVRRMFLLEDWFVFSPEPYAGETGAAVSPACEVERRAVSGADCGQERWQWLRLAYGDNSLVKAVCGKLPSDLSAERTLVFPCYDFENSRETMGLCGIAENGEIVWGKRDL